MRPQIPSFGALGAILLLGCGGLAACAPGEPPSAAIEDRLAAVAIIESIDHRSRDVLLRGPAGGLITVKAGPEVRNLDQVRAGDRVRVAYQQAIAVHVSPPGGTLSPVERDTAAIRAARGERPAGAAYDVVFLRVRIEAVDRNSGAVTFTGPNEVTRTIVPREPNMRGFARRLRPGDEVEVAYLEALAISVEPAPT
jgi:hypothetical protein